MTSRPARISIAHHNRLFRECLVSVLSDVPGLQVTAVDHGRPDCLESIQSEPPDLFLLSVNLPGRMAVEWTRQVRQELTATKVLLLARGKSEDHLYECFEAGVHGCVLEESSLADLRGAVASVLRGEAFCSPRLVYAMFQRLNDTAHRARWQQRVESLDLTSRELEIVQLIAQRLSNKEIARKLSLSLYTVKNHVHNIVEKLKVQDRFGAVEHARKHGWLTAGRPGVPLGGRG